MSADRRTSLARPFAGRLWPVICLTLLVVLTGCDSGDYFVDGGGVYGIVSAAIALALAIVEVAS